MEDPWAVVESWKYLEVAEGPVVLVVGPFEDEAEARSYLLWTQGIVIAKQVSGMKDDLAQIGLCQMIKPDPDWREEGNWSGDRG